MNVDHSPRLKPAAAKTVSPNRARLLRGWLWLAFAFLLTMPASAHANLSSASPAANTQLDTPPDAVRLTFTEPVEPIFSGIRLLDLTGKDVAGGGKTEPDDPYTLILPLAQALPDGVYTVVWRAASAADGHSTRGSYVFGIGMAAGTRAVTTIEESFAPATAAARWMDMLGTALTSGLLAFALMVWRPGIAQGLPPRDDRFTTMLWAGWILYGSGLLVGLLAQASTATGSTFVEVITDGRALRLMTASNSAPIWLSRAAVWLAFGGALRAMGNRPTRWHIPVVLGLALAVLPSFISHARAAGSADALINDMLHRIAAALWIGGLAGWTVALWGDGFSNIKAVGKAVSRFSNLARFYVLLLAAGGLFAAIQYIPSADALLDTGYGRALTAKGVLFALMFALAGFNLLFAERRLKRGQARWLRVLIATTGAELSLGAALMLMSAIMAASVPARDVIAQRAQAAEQSTLAQSTPYYGMAVEDDIMVHLEISPGRAGENIFIIAPYLLPDALPLEDETRVRLRFTHREHNLGESTLNAVSTGDGFYSAEGTNLSIPGPWRVRVTVQRPGAYDAVLDFDITIDE